MNYCEDNSDEESEDENCDDDDCEWEDGRFDKPIDPDPAISGRKKRLFLQKVNKVKCLIQVIYYTITNGKKKTPFQVWTSVEIYNRCRSRELITIMNRMSLCLSYKAMRNHRTDLMKYAVLRSEGSGIPIPSHFSLEEFTIAAFDNFNHADRNTLSGKSIANDTAIVLFQTIPKVKLK